MGAKPHTGAMAGIRFCCKRGPVRQVFRCTIPRQVRCGLPWAPHATDELEQDRCPVIFARSRSRSNGMASKSTGPTACAPVDMPASGPSVMMRTTTSRRVVSVLIRLQASKPFMPDIATSIRTHPGFGCHLRARYTRMKPPSIGHNFRPGTLQHRLQDIPYPGIVIDYQNASHDEGFHTWPTPRITNVLFMSVHRLSAHAIWTAITPWRRTARKRTLGVCSTKTCEKILNDDFHKLAGRVR
jgi:hypothetical protein